MKTATILVCVFVKKANLDSRALFPLRGAANIVEPLLINSRERTSSEPESNLDPCEDSDPILEVIVITLAALLMFIAFAVMEVEVPKRKPGETFQKSYLFTARAKVTPENHGYQYDGPAGNTNGRTLNRAKTSPGPGPSVSTPKNAPASANGMKEKKLSGSLRFRKGFLYKKRPSSAVNKIIKEFEAAKVVKPTGVAALIDRTKNAKEISQGNVSLVYELYGEDGMEAAIFKPYDDPRNGETDDKLSNIVVSTKNHCLNEVSAYLFDQAMPINARAGVPETQHVELPSELFGMGVNNKAVRGSIQFFLHGTESCEDYGPSMFLQDDVHKLGILDMRILNCDRHTGNILINTKTKQLSPIDHALAFPEFCLEQDKKRNPNCDKNLSKLELADVSFDWMMFPQAKQPFSEELRAAIESIDIAQDVERMKVLGMTVQQRLAVFMSGTVLRVGGIEMGKTLYELGSIVQRSGARDEPSILEALAAETLDTVNSSKLQSGDESEFDKFCAGFTLNLEKFFKI